MTATLHDLLKSYREGGVFPSYDQLAALIEPDQSGAVAGCALRPKRFILDTNGLSYEQIAAISAEYRIDTHIVSCIINAAVEAAPLPDQSGAALEKAFPAARFENVTGFVDADFVQFDAGETHGYGVAGGKQCGPKHYTRSFAAQWVADGSWREVAIGGAAVRGEAVADAATDQLYGAVMNILCKMGRATEMHGATKQAYKEGHRDARHAAADLIAAFSSSARAADAPSEPTDLSHRLRETADKQPGWKPLLDAAAEEIERYYGGMLAWKKTAEKKDADWNAIVRAADALDSQPTEQMAAFMAYFCAKFNRPYTLEFDDLSGNELEYYDFWQSAQASSQPTDGGVRNG